LYSMFLLQVQNRRPHLTWQRSSNVKFDHMPTVTPSSLATAATCETQISIRHCCWQQLYNILSTVCFCCKFKNAGRISRGNAAAMWSLIICRRSLLPQ
jgi:hypothetical protein